ncbi:hypothetical protein LEN26_001173 [Aphanomyces euteiches]|nr:hypothetical protein AeMF1_002506 [Aphanomyces euteiches]KAH9161972.1 hypothetical protein LEN26_001173 [Aphanomyces euteiches]
MHVARACIVSDASVRYDIVQAVSFFNLISISRMDDDDICSALLCGALWGCCCAAAAQEDRRQYQQPVIVQTVHPVLVPQRNYYGQPSPPRYAYTLREQTYMR